MSNNKVTAQQVAGLAMSVSACGVAGQYARGVSFNGGDLMVLRYQDGASYIDVCWETHTAWDDNDWHAKSIDLHLSDMPSSMLQLKTSWRALMWAGLTTEAYNLATELLKQPPAAAWLVSGSTVAHRVREIVDHSGNVVQEELAVDYDALCGTVVTEMKNWPEAVQDYLVLFLLYKATKTQRDLMRSVLNSAPGVYLLLTYENGRLDWSNVSVVQPGCTHRTLKDVFALYFPKRDVTVTHKLCPLHVTGDTSVVVLVREFPDWNYPQWAELVGKPAIVVYDLLGNKSLPVSVRTLPKKLHPLVELEPSMLIDVSTDAGNKRMPAWAQTDRPMFPVDMEMLPKMLVCLRNGRLNRSMVIVDSKGPLVDMFRWLARTGYEDFALHVCICDENGPSAADWCKIAEKLLCQNLRQVLVENKDWVAGSWSADIHPLFDLEGVGAAILRLHECSPETFHQFF